MSFNNVIRRGPEFSELEQAVAANARMPVILDHDVPVFYDEKARFGGESAEAERSLLGRVVLESGIISPNAVNNAADWYDIGSVNINHNRMTSKEVDTIVAARNKFFLEFLAGGNIDSPIAQAWSKYTKKIARGMAPSTFMNACSVYDDYGINIGFLLNQKNLFPFSIGADSIDGKVNEIGKTLDTLSFDVDWGEIDFINEARGALSAKSEKLLVIGEFVRLSKGNSPKIKELADLIAFNPAEILVAAKKREYSASKLRSQMRDSRGIAEDRLFAEGINRPTGEQINEEVKFLREEAARRVVDEVNGYNTHANWLLEPREPQDSQNGYEHQAPLPVQSPLSALVRAYEAYNIADKPTPK